mmetsp:Transcript_4016/g.9882  ORF Transcript_4016/g.9882 Transcript_4016/m.9882 type:complete len:762 (+) Transcript_4016:2619-4904(+)
MTINRNGGFSTDSYQILGLLQNFKTGDFMVDTIIAMCLPLILKVFFSWISKHEKWMYPQTWYQWWYGNVRDVKEKHERLITFVSRVDNNGRTVNMSTNTQNAALSKAINLFLHEVVQLELQTAYLDLSETQNDNRCLNGRRILPNGTMFAMLSRYDIISRIPPGQWYDIGSYGEPVGRVKLRISNNNQGSKNSDGVTNDSNDGIEDLRRTRNAGDGSGGKDATTTTLHLTSDTKGSCDAFVKAAYSWYLEKLQKNEANHQRYYYEMKQKESSWALLGSNGNDDGGGGGNQRTTFKRYLLSEEKTFANLFFPEKKNLLSLMNHFTNKTGKYAIAGYPQKLGILLHGPPGTGKTSLIKAMAQLTGRSVINVPLNQIKTNSELMSIIYDRQFRLENGLNINMEFRDIIFVFEDIDCAADVVKRRDGKTDIPSFDDDNLIELPAPKSVFRMLLESTSNECTTLVNELVKRSERLKQAEEIQRPEAIRALTQRLSSLPGLGLVGAIDNPTMVSKVCNSAIKTSNDLQAQCSKLDKILTNHAAVIKKQLAAGAIIDDDLVDELLGDVTSVQGTISLAGSSFSSTNDDEPYYQPASGSDTPPTNPDSQLRAIMEMGFTRESPRDVKTDKKDDMGYEGFASSWLRPDPDKLSLAGILNVLDGVVDSPSRIVIMTTNHPELLDPALIRPGRIDRKLLLGYMSSPDVVSMLEHFFQEDLTDEQSGRIATAVSEGVTLTPAEVEQLAAENDDIDGMVETIESKSRPKLQFKL